MFTTPDHVLPLAIPLITYLATPDLSISFVFLVSHFSVLHEKERASIRNIFWRARWKTVAKLEKQHLLFSQTVCTTL